MPLRRSFDFGRIESYKDAAPTALKLGVSLLLLPDTDLGFSQFQRRANPATGSLVVLGLIAPILRGILSPPNGEGWDEGWIFENQSPPPPEQRKKSSAFTWPSVPDGAGRLWPQR